MATADIGRDRGILYVLASRDSSLTKVGMTRTGTPELRASQYEQQHGVVWRCVYWRAETYNVAAVEARIHRELAPYRFALTPGALEIYHLIPAKAVSVAQRYVIQSLGASPFPTSPYAVRARSAWLEAFALTAVTALCDNRRLHWALRSLLRRLLNHLLATRRHWK